ncbi:molybdopterin molybdotransferase MoeA [Alkalihalobacterium elongatum]|uniref:molybdopterin molybdotransferase MoeA n=1 Tax=Alkalihalobacterium elongatum TaxID=2675466 RepID=UPI001C1FFCF6|nr:gephyrin-like molybdotransferase Glp [Alkalihalobacterium elongatum]
MVERRTPIPVKDAVNKIMDLVKRSGEIEYVAIEECLGRYLGQPLKADHDVPPFNRSPYDGFALRSEDTKAASSEQPVTIEVIEEIGAGTVAIASLKQNQAIRIMTGAQIPNGADAVIMLELVKEVQKDEKTYIQVKRKVAAGDNISRQGEDVQNSAVLLDKGTKINEGTVALLATFGYAKVPVFKKPVVGIIATGSELLEVDQALEPGKIRNSNGYMIAAQIQKVGAEPKFFGKLADDFDTCYQKIKQTLAEVDVLVTTGGVSVGDFDHLPGIYKKLEAEILFNKIAMRPGSVTTVAVKDGKFLFGLSGNPSACFVGFELFVRPAILSLFETDRVHLQKEQAILDKDFPKPNPFTRFVRSKVSIEKGKLVVAPVGLDKSGVVSSIAYANALLMLPGGTRGFERGMEVDVLLLNGEGSASLWGEQ